MYLASRRNIAIILAMVFAVPTSLIASTPAYADEYDGANASTIVAPQTPTKVDSPTDPSQKPPSGPCSRALPNFPVITCGYSSFSDKSLGFFADRAGQQRSRAASGLPPEFWNKQGSSEQTYMWGKIESRYTHAYNRARDLAYGPVPGQPEPKSFAAFNRNRTGTESMYYSKGVHWRDTRFWQERVKIDKSKVTVSVGYPKEVTTVIQKGYWVSAKYNRAGKLISPRRYVPARTKTEIVKPTPKVVPVQIILQDSTNLRQPGVVKSETCREGTCTYNVRKLTFYPEWTARTVVFSGLQFHKMPETIEIWCQTELGPGKLIGPYDHNRQPLNSQIGYKKTDLDPQTTLRQWWTKPPDNLASRTKKDPRGGFILMSEIGERQEKAKGIFVRGNKETLSLVKNCIQKKPTYKADAAKQPCVVLEPSSPFFGKELPASHELCQAFVPGNYIKDLSESKEMKCIYTKRSWVGRPATTLYPSLQDNFRIGSDMLVGRPTSSAEGFNAETFIHCDKPISAKNNPDRPQSPNAIGYPITKAFWACEGDRPEKGNNMWHPDRNYDFLTCGYTFACVVPGGDPRPMITDVNSNTRSRSSSQVLASGAQTRVSWNAPSQIAVYDSRGRLVDRVAPDRDKAWQQWRVLDGSAPWSATKDPNDRSQPAFGSNLINQDPSSGQSILNGAKNGWDTPDLYLRGYKGTNVADATRRIGDIVVRQGELIPFAVDTEYRATIPKDMIIFDRPVQINQPVVCTMPPAYLYFLSGRATG